MALQGPARRGIARQAWSGKARQGLARRGKAGMARHGLARQAGRGEVRPGVAWLGEAGRARLGMARRGKAGVEFFRCPTTGSHQQSIDASGLSRRSPAARPARRPLGSQRMSSVLFRG